MHAYALLERPACAQDRPDKKRSARAGPNHETPCLGTQTATRVCRPRPADPQDQTATSADCEYWAARRMQPPAQVWRPRACELLTSCRQRAPLRVSPVLRGSPGACSRPEAGLRSWLLPRRPPRICSHSAGGLFRLRSRSANHADRRCGRMLHVLLSAHYPLGRDRSGPIVRFRAFAVDRGASVTVRHDASDRTATRRESKPVGMRLAHRACH
jgi:hypothetical protein